MRYTPIIVSFIFACLVFAVQMPLAAGNSGRFENNSERPANAVSAYSSKGKRFNGRRGGEGLSKNKMIQGIRNQVGNVFPKQPYSKKRFERSKIKVIIEGIRERKVLINRFRGLGFVDVTEHAFILDKNKRPIKLSDIPVPCRAYVAIGRSSAEGVFVFLLQYLGGV